MKWKLFSNHWKLENEEQKNFKTKNHHIIAPIKDELNAFNEETIKLLAQAIVNVLNKDKIFEIKMLIANDGSHKLLANFEKKMVNVISFQCGKLYTYEKNLPVSEAFLKFTNDAADAFLISIYLHKYNHHNKYAISFFNKDNEPINHKFIKKILEEYKNLQFEDIKEFIDEYQKLNFNKILKEYTDFILQKNFTKNPNHLLKIGVINSSLQNTFVKRILGKNDIAYTVLKNKNKEEKPHLLKFSWWHYSNLKNVEYIIKFSYDFKKLYLYKRNYHKKLCLQYELIDISDLISNYLAFINNYHININKNFQPIKNLYTSYFIKQQNIEEIADKLQLNLKIDWIFNPNKIIDQNSLYFDEEYNVFLSNSKKYGYDAFAFLSVIVDMLNYYQTQEMKYDDICEQNLVFQKQFLVSEFKYYCDFKNLSDFETKLFVQDKIGQLKVNSIENITNYFKNDNEKYIAKFNFAKNEWMSIVYDFKNENLIFIIHETNKTKGNIAKKIKNFMYKFTKKYHKPLIDFKF
ncbi:hypothetical protein [Metamycoplasma alkalescens]|uniref:hypothetical protein n=1 Tax=Metamycoplasma alkalescens TaxID=45363 RepID=UPI003D08ADE6